MEVCPGFASPSLPPSPCSRAPRLGPGPASLPALLPLATPWCLPSGPGAGLMMPSESGAESPDQAAAQVGTAAASAVATAAPAGGGPDPKAASASLGRHLSGLSWPQVKRLDALLNEPIPIHGRGNFPTLSVQPRQIVQVRGRWEGLWGPQPEVLVLGGTQSRRSICWTARELEAYRDTGTVTKSHSAWIVDHAPSPLGFPFLPPLGSPIEPFTLALARKWEENGEGLGCGKGAPGGGRTDLPPKTRDTRQPWIGRCSKSFFCFTPKSSWRGLTTPTPLPSLKVLGSDFVLCSHSSWLKRPVAKWKSQEIPIRTPSLSAGLVAGGD